MKRIVLCADDFGQALAVNEGVAALLKMQRLTAVSCMVNEAHWLSGASLLKPYISQIDVGLHFNLTHGAPLSAAFRAKYGPQFPTLGRLYKMGFMKRLSVDDVVSELHAQLDCFQEGMGCLPDFIDGHQHIQHFPAIRDALLAVYQRKLQGKKPYIRLSMPSFQFESPRLWVKKCAIALTGAIQFKSLLKKASIPHNTCFSGIYHFDLNGQYRQYMQGFLAGVSDNGLIMCHPGYASNDPSDPIAKARFQEFQYLSSDEFGVDCKKAGVQLVQFA